MNQSTRIVSRETGIDLIKLIACLGVVSLHTLYPGKGPTVRIITLLAGTSIPLFFMVSGYLMFRKKEIHYSYVLTKIRRILLICLSWEALHALAYLLYYRQLRNFLTSFVLDFFQKGLFYHFWYLGALILMYLAMPAFHRLLAQSPRQYRIILICLSLFCAATDLLQAALGQYLILQIPQNLRVWNWLLYTMAGGYLAKYSPEIPRFSSLHQKALLLIPALSVACIWQYLLGTLRFGSISIESFYGAFPLQLAVAALFLTCRNLRFSTPLANCITCLSNLSMGIYITHPFILPILSKFVPAFIQSSEWMNLLYWIATVMLCGLITGILQKLPVLNRLLHL